MLPMLEEWIYEFASPSRYSTWNKGKAVWVKNRWESAAWCWGGGAQTEPVYKCVQLVCASEFAWQWGSEGGEKTEQRKMKGWKKQMGRKAGWMRVLIYLTRGLISEPNCRSLKGIKWNLCLRSNKYTQSSEAPARSWMFPYWELNTA